MPRNKSEQKPPGFEQLNEKQLDHMRNEALWRLKVDSRQVQEVSWRRLSISERAELCAGDLDTHKLRTFYMDQYRAAQSK